MKEKYIITELHRNADVFKKLLNNVPEEIYLWRQNEKKWCMLGIICHLYDEEREDFRARVKLVLENPQLPANPINPVGWVTERKYIEQNYNTVLANFLNERNISVEWLNQLKDPIWGNVYTHPKIGDLSAKMFLINWLAHDYLHIRQIIKLKYDYLKEISGENLSYAGEW
jgi:hypothetical protein